MSPQSSSPQPRPTPSAHPPEPAATSPATGSPAATPAAPDPPAPRAGLVLLLACGGSFVSLLDVTIANLAVPDLHRDFTGASLADLTWVMSLYAIAFAALLAPAGRLADVVGRRRLYRAGLVVFTLASAACAAAPDLTTLLVARAVQGLGAAALVPASLAIVLAQIPAHRRTAAIGAWSASASLAAALGPSLGGVLVDLFGWRSVFLVTVPLGAGLLLLTRAASDSRSGEPVPDLVGSALLATGIGALVLGVTQGSAWGWDDPRTLACVVAGLVLIGASVARASRHPRPGLEVGLWRSRQYAYANVVSFLFGMLLYPWLLLGVLYLTQIWHYSELRAGFAMTHGAVVSALAGLAVGRFAHRVDPRTAVVGGSLLLAGTALWIGLAMPEEPSFVALWLPSGVLLGLGIGAVSTGVSQAGALSAPPAGFAGATGLNLTARQIGGALGLAVLATVMNREAGNGTDGFTRLFVMFTVLGVLTALAGLGLAARPTTGGTTTAPTTGPATAAAADPDARPAPADPHHLTETR
ncbi:DHA2 family efflux MFS transporter permease subunit [Yinghuangia sp. ASG 101]|uniref:DHA2 family efflux MFS transporter permease subunit n=1 Tax=Yinghuangia sp. ASG 101 TaxID=2896848 RepID=UPI001E4CAE09|nr:DHA2 family efflux MFS transporter permease subunit [Yinghuangia sp. ASG 101]UGQ12873.1 DHA2 family efflux MFS transporter permease subunit [Yinghuangia sp. ASG 101]